MRSLFIIDVQAHSLGGGIIDADDLVQGDQVLFLRDLRVGTCPSDVDGSGSVGFDDLPQVLSDYGSSC